MACPHLGVRRRLSVGGVRSPGCAQGLPVPSGRPQAGEDRSGELLEPSLMPRYPRPGLMGRMPGAGTGRCEAAGAGR